MNNYTRVHTHTQAYKAVRRRETTILRPKKVDFEDEKLLYSLGSLACMLKDIYLLKRCPYGMDFLLITLELHFEHES